MLRQRFPAWLAAAVAAFAYVTLSVLIQGQDANWDLRNYHLYTPVALMEGRWGSDVAAAQLQTWHNPSLDFPLAWLIRAGAPGWLVSVWLALPAFIAMFFALRLMDRLWPRQRSGFRTGVAGLFAVTGAAVMPGIGASFNDAFVAAGVLPALWWAVDSQHKRGAWATWLPVGLLAGAVAGFKLTAAMYCLGFAAAAMATGPVRAMPGRLIALAVGGVTAASLTAGPWAWRLWQEHGNPLFPYFNQWFQSPDALPFPHKDDRFLPDGWLDTLLVPFHLLSDSRRFSESTLADPRLLLGLIAIAVMLAVAVRARRSGARLSGAGSSEAGSSEAGRATTGEPAVAAFPWLLPAFVLVSYVVWLQLYGIYRYLFALELVLSVTIVGMLSTFAARRFYRTALVLFTLVIVVATNRPGWGRQSFSSPMVRVEFPSLPPDSLVVIADDDPLAHAVAFLPRQVAALSLRNNFMDPTRCTRLQGQVEERIRGHAGPFYLLREVKDVPALAGPYNAYGLSIDGACVPIVDSLRDLQLCPLARTDIKPPICLSSAAGR
jgi:hypothetical protein